MSRLPSKAHRELDKKLRKLGYHLEDTRNHCAVIRTADNRRIDTVSSSTSDGYRWTMQVRSQLRRKGIPLD